MKTRRCSATRRFGAAALLLFAAAAPLTAQSPPPASSPSQLPEIGRVRSRGLCTTVRDSVAPMVLGLMKSDELVGAGHRAFLKMSDDTRRGGGPALEMDQLYLRRVADAMAHNLRVVDKLLADERNFPKKASSDDDRIAQQLKEQISAAAAQQRKTLDILNGALETEALGRMQNELAGGSLGASTQSDTTPKGSVLLPSPRATDPAGSFIGAAGLSMPSVMPTFDPRTMGRSTNGSRTIWDLLVSGVESQQRAIAAAEQRLTPTVVSISIACRAELSSPSPKP